MKKFFSIVATLFCLLGTVQAENLSLTKPEQMTPLVGNHCVINQIDKDLIEAFGNTSSLGNLIDTNVDNYVSLSGLAGVDVPITRLFPLKTWSIITVRQMPIKK